MPPVRALARLASIIAALTLVMLTVASEPPSASGLLPTTLTWTGLGGDANWSTPQNWSGNMAPAGGENLVFPDSAMQKTNTDDLTAATALFNSISFTGPAGGYIISGNGFLLQNGITADNNGPNFFYPPITLTKPQIFDISGDRLGLYGSVDLGTNGLTLQGDGVLELRGGITGTGGITSSVPYAFVGDVDATYTGATNVTSGQFALSGADLDPASVVTVSGGTFLMVNGHSAGAVTVQSGASIALQLGGSSEIGHVQDVTLQTGSNIALGMYSTSDYGQLVVSGSASLGNSNLVIGWVFSSSSGDTFKIIDKTSVGPVSGIFAGHAEGSQFNNSGRRYQITYAGGDGNDVVLSDVGPATTPSPSPTPTPTPTQSASPSPSPTPTHSATPSPTPSETLTQGDLNCSGHIDGFDALLPLYYSTGAQPVQGECPSVGSGTPYFGDVDCNGDITTPDMIRILKYVIGLHLDPIEGCTPIGSALP